MRNVRQFSAVFGFSLPLFYLFWIVFVGTFSFHETLIGVIGSALASAGLSIINLFYPAHFSPKLTDVLTLWRIPGYLISGTWRISAIAIKDLARIERAKSVFRVVPFRAGAQDDPHATARRVLAVIYMTVTPSTIVLGVNSSGQKLLFHEMGRTPVPRMLEELGAQV